MVLIPSVEDQKTREQAKIADSEVSAAPILQNDRNEAQKALERLILVCLTHPLLDKGLSQFGCGA